MGALSFATSPAAVVTWHERASGAVGMEDAGVWIATLNDESQSSKAKLAALAALAQLALASPDEVLTLFDGVDVAFERLLVDKEVSEGSREGVACFDCPGG